ncbi:hypothetical protein ANANG_G00040540 [Anguilla anguilla]|uniref:Uncharacterized protein n=1 Tax=Anguilla anguilla TaxID=7936 RepID=A0A9D3S7L2_ANGAN|nr:hypothetical protein ANANG_G00040540 [Anguilla anguilla]
MHSEKAGSIKHVFNVSSYSLSFAQLMNVAGAVHRCIIKLPSTGPVSLWAHLLSLACLKRPCSQINSADALLRFSRKVLSLGVSVLVLHAYWTCWPHTLWHTLFTWSKASMDKDIAVEIHRQDGSNTTSAQSDRTSNLGH